MTLWQRICTVGLAILESTGLLYDQTAGNSPSTLLHDLNHPLGQTDIKPLPPYPYTLSPYDFTSNNECNSPNDRKRWCFHQNINTDYEDIPLVPNTGVTRNITLVITSNNTFCGDGYCRETMLINGTYPGPLIRGNWGDWFNITVINNLTNGNGTAIHWHGLRQFRTVWSDGVPGVTQCPIEPGGNQTYQFRATQYGTSWYHSHFSLQYADGIAGPLIIDGPTTTDYDEDKGPLMLTDWYHASAFSIYWEETMLNGTGPPKPQSKLVNGIGMYTKSSNNGTLTVFGCDPEDDDNCKPELGGMYGTNIEYGKKYKFRLINTSATTHFSFWIEGHSFTIVATDFVPIEPYQVNYVNVAIGQRYDIIVEAKASKKALEEKYKSQTFWIKMRNCDKTCIGDPCPKGPGKCTDKDFEECRQGAIFYDLKHKGDPNKNWKVSPAPVDRCSDPPRDKIKPWVRRDLTGHISKNLRFHSPFQVQNQEAEPQQPPTTSNYTKVNLWNIKYNDVMSPFMIDWEKPTLQLVNDAKPLDPSYVPIEIDGQDSEWTVFAIASNWKSNNPYAAQHAVPGAAHPIHLHGHDFVVLSQVTNTTLRNATLDLNGEYGLDLFNPPRRDVVMLPEDGYVVIAFRVDNPGTWLMHCHIAWHASAGLALQWIERRDDIPKLLKGPKAKGVIPRLDKQCKTWKDYYEGSKEKQDDSGI